MKNMQRALRRHHMERLKRKRKKQLYYTRLFIDCYSDITERDVGMFVNTPCMCSCWICGNQRKRRGPTLQERRCQVERDPEDES